MMNSQIAVTCVSQLDGHTLSTSASSATLYGSQVPFFYLQDRAEILDMTIAQGLLEKEDTHIPLRRKSCTHFAAAPDRAVLQIHDPAPPEMASKTQNRRSRYYTSSNTWTSSTGDDSDYHYKEDRTPFVEEYNRLAKKYGVSTIVPEEFFPVDFDKVTIFAKKGSWIMRKLLRRTSGQSSKRKQEKPQLRHKRSVSDLTLRLKSKKDLFKDKSLEELVRLCGASALYLPSEYAASTLAVPTCFRATAQYLVQHAATARGIFRIPGSHSTVMALYNHYASEDEYGDVISDTVRCPTLPDHIKCDVHDVASAFKKFLAGLPGGILGKAWLFDAFVAIHNQLDSDPEWTRTKQSRLRSRLIALAIASTAPKYQRQLICAVLGLLSMIGRAAETAKREDDHGRPLPTSNLMGYSSLGVVFGPLLIGEILETHDLRLSGPHGTLNLVQKYSPKSMKSRNRKVGRDRNDASVLREGAEKVRVANKITEMLITHWRDVVRHMKNLGALRSRRPPGNDISKTARPALRPSASESFVIRKPPQWEPERNPMRQHELSVSPSPTPRNGPASSLNPQLGEREDRLSVRKQRSRPQPTSSQILSGARSISILAPTVEENQDREENDKGAPKNVEDYHVAKINAHRARTVDEFQSMQTYHTARSRSRCGSEFAPWKDKTDVSFISISEAPIADQKSSSDSPSSHQSLLQALNTVELAKANDTKDDQAFPTKLSATQSAANSPVNTDTVHYSTITGCIELSASETAERSQSVENPMMRMTTPRMRIKYQTERATQRRMPSSLPPNGLDSTRFSEGLVSQRVRGIAASDPGEPPSGFQTLSKASDGNSHCLRRKGGSTNQASQFLSDIVKDPLSRISQQEDMASLATLAEAMQSQESRAHSRIGTAESQDSKVKTSVTSTTRESIHHDPSGRADEPHFRNLEPEDLKYFTELPPITLPTSRRTLISHKPGGSVRELAAIFNSGAELGNSPSPSSKKAHSYHQSTRSRDEKKVVSPYTSNKPLVRSPQHSSKWTESDGSSRVCQNRLSLKIAPDLSHKTPLPNSLGSSQDSVSKFPMDGAHDSNSRLFFRTNALDDPAFRRQFKPAFTSGTDINQKTSFGNTGPTVDKRHSLGTLLPRPTHSSTDQYLLFERPASTAISGHQYHPMSPLDSQVQGLEQHLLIEEREAGRLRRQPEIVNGINELQVLSDELRRTEKELTLWKKRAEIAEKQLARISNLAVKDSIHPGMPAQSPFNLERRNGGGIIDSWENARLLDKQQHGSNGTIRRLRGCRTGTMSEYGPSDFDDVRDILRAYEDGLYELE